MYGFKVHPRPPSARSAMIDAFQSLPVAVVSDVMSRISAGGAQLRPMHDSAPLAGCALIVMTRPGDSLIIHQVLDLAVPGDVIVVNASGDLTNALTGEIMAAYVVSGGVAGFVIDGVIRETASIRAGCVPVYATGMTHRGPYRDGAGEINVPVALECIVVARHHPRRRGRHTLRPRRRSGDNPTRGVRRTCLGRRLERGDHRWRP